MTADRPREDGSAPVAEFALGVPLVGVLLWLLLWAGTVGHTPAALQHAVRDAARHAATIRQPDLRPAVIEQLLVDRTAPLCDDLTVTTTQQNRLIRVTVSCLLSTREQNLLQVRPRTVTATGRATVDQWFVEDGP